MNVLDPGHRYELRHLDGDGVSTLTFVKREGLGYPGNVGHWEGTNLQEVLRALIDRLQYLNGQIADRRNDRVLHCLRLAIWQLELRAAERHGRCDAAFLAEYDVGQIEAYPTCATCGHIGCGGTCHV